MSSTEFNSSTPVVLIASGGRVSSGEDELGHLRLRFQAGGIAERIAESTGRARWHAARRRSSGPDIGDHLVEGGRVDLVVGLEQSGSRRSRLGRASSSCRGHLAVEIGLEAPDRRRGTRWWRCRCRRGTPRWPAAPRAPGPWPPTPRDRRWPGRRWRPAGGLLRSDERQGPTDRRRRRERDEHGCGRSGTSGQGGGTTAASDTGGGGRGGGHRTVHEGRALRR